MISLQDTEQLYNLLNRQFIRSIYIQMTPFFFLKCRLKSALLQSSLSKEADKSGVCFSKLLEHFDAKKTTNYFMFRTFMNGKTIFLLERSTSKFL